jgi:hypothetical protein
MTMEDSMPYKLPDQMSAGQYNRALTKIGLSNYAAAPLLGVSLRQLQRVSLGQTGVPRPVAILLRLLLKGKISVEDVREAG